MHWENLPSDYLDYAGFVYEITNKLTGQKYIGRKYFYMKRKKALLENDWATYTGSSIDLNNDIEKYGKNNFKFEIVGLGKDRTEVNYMEVALQIQNNVLYAMLEDGSRAYYNRNILSKYFQPREFGSPEYYEKCKRISDALKEGFASGKIIHGMFGKVHPNKGKTLPQTGHSKNKGRVWYTDGKVNMVLNSDDPIPINFRRGQTRFAKYVNKLYIRKRAEYVDNPVKCLICEKELPFEERNNKCCSKRCSNKLIAHKASIRYLDSPLCKTHPKYDKGKLARVEKIKSYYEYEGTLYSRDDLIEKLGITKAAFVWRFNHGQLLNITRKDSDA